MVDLFALVAQLVHDVVARVLGLVGHLGHHLYPVCLVLGLAVYVQHPLSV